jgi:hypothetical protein
MITAVFDIFEILISIKTTGSLTIFMEVSRSGKRQTVHDKAF